MTFAEIILLCLFAAAIYRLLRPAQQRLERWIYRRASPTLKNQSLTVTNIRRTTKED